MVALTLTILAFSWWWSLPRGADGPAPEVTYSELLDLVEANKVEQVTLRGISVRGDLKGEETLRDTQSQSFVATVPENDPALLSILRNNDVVINVESDEQSTAMTILLSLLPWVILIGLWVWISRRARNMMEPTGVGNLLKPRDRKISGVKNTQVRFDDVAGLGSAKAELEEVVEFLRAPQKFARLGGKVPRGVLLVGPPGTGKTLLARAVAGEAGTPFYSISGSEFIELFVGMGARRVRELFSEAKKSAPAILFIDEIDAIGRSRGAGLGGGHDEREQTLNQLLAEMDGFERTDQTVVLAATNRPDVLDPALLRPGRFDRQVHVGRPEAKARLDILKVHTRDKPLADDVDLSAVARSTPGFSGAELENLVNEAAIHAVRRNGTTITAKDLSDAYDRVVLGTPKEGKLSVEEKERVAVHEAGHATVAHFSPHADALRRVSIIPRGMALGATHQMPAHDRYLLTQPELEARLRVLMGGHAAERVQLGTVSTGAEDDLKNAARLARQMVAHFGMSQEIGAVYYDVESEHPFLGQRIATDAATSDATVHTIEREARSLLQRALQEATEILEEKREPFGQLVQVLLDRETVNGDELCDILGTPRRARESAPVPQLHSRGLQ